MPLRVQKVPALRKKMVCSYLSCGDPENPDESQEDPNFELAVKFLAVSGMVLSPALSTTVMAILILKSPNK